MLEIRDAGIGAEGGKAIGEGLRFNRVLKTLRIYANGIGNQGAQSLADAIKTNDSCALKELWIDNSLWNHENLKAACKIRGVELT